MAQLVNAMETLEEINQTSAASHGGDNPNPLRLQLADLLRNIDDWLGNISGMEAHEQELT